MWVCIHIDKYIDIIETAQLIVENSAQTSFRFSPVSFRATRFYPIVILASKIGVIALPPPATGKCPVQPQILDYDESR